MLKNGVDIHNKSLGAKYTKTRLPVRLVYTECFNSKSEAMKREYQIKQLTRQQKLILIKKYENRSIYTLISKFVHYLKSHMIRL